MDALNTIATVLDAGQKTNSYKYALTLALSEIETPVVPALQLAERFLGYYWPLATRYRIRQSTDPSKEPVAFKWSAELHNQLCLETGEDLRDVKRRHPQEIESLVSRLSQRGGCLDEVLPRYHTLHREQVASPIFAVEGRGIRVSEPAWNQIADNRKVVRQLAIGGWVSFCERISATPKMHLKLSGETPQRKSLTPYQTLLTSFAHRRCFYCGNDNPADIHVDHFLPWSFILEDKLWNLVIACGGSTGCNLRKSDRIPDKALVGDLLVRNQRMLDGVYGESVRDHRDLKEWKIWDLSRHVEQLAATALAEGFPLWQRPLSS
jgi:5-methylcytosine-specific restriction endonuclease McrA